MNFLEVKMFENKIVLWTIAGILIAIYAFLQKQGVKKYRKEMKNRRVKTWKKENGHA
jgi:hypothetical protein